MFEQLYTPRSNVGAIVVASRWPRGFEYPHAVASNIAWLTTRDLYRCARCRQQTSPIAGTIFTSPHLPIRLWFRAIYHPTQTTVWKMKHKLKQVMLERDATKRLTGPVEIDEACLGGLRSGGKRGPGAPGETPVRRRDGDDRRKESRSGSKLRRATSFCAAAISRVRAPNPVSTRTALSSVTAASVADRMRTPDSSSLGSGPENRSHAGIQMAQEHCPQQHRGLAITGIRSYQPLRARLVPTPPEFEYCLAGKMMPLFNAQYMTRMLRIASMPPNAMRCRPSDTL